MDSIRSVLHEELGNSRRMLGKYRKELNKLLKGAFVKKVIRGHDYYYLARRDGEKVVFDYLGKLKPEEVKKYEKEKALKAQYRESVAKLKNQVKFLERALNG